MEKEKSENPESNNLKKEDEEVRNNVSVSDNKEENKIGESKEKEEEDEDDELDYFDPLNEKGELVIPLKTKNKFKKKILI